MSSPEEFPIVPAQPFTAALSPYTDAGGEFVVPDFIGEITAWRVWRVLHKTWRLQSLGAGSRTHAIVWQPDARMEATCRDSDKHEVPGETCSCGFYAAIDRDHLLSMSYHMGYNFEDKSDVLVIGTVALSGKVIPGTQGYRAQRARPIEVLVPYSRWRVVKPLREQYPKVAFKLENFLKKGETK